jgi:hypothetical protein
MVVDYMGKIGVGCQINATVVKQEEYKEQLRNRSIRSS